MVIDPSYDDDFEYPHLDDPRINDLPAGTVQHIIEPEDGLLSDMVNELDLTDDFKLKEGDEY